MWLCAAHPARPEGHKIVGAVTTVKGGRTVADATVTIWTPQGKQIRRLSTDKSGHYDSGRLDAGIYFITAAFGNLASHDRVEVRLAPGQIRRIDVSLNAVSTVRLTRSIGCSSEFGHTLGPRWW
jgi:hypothetical protein